MDRFQVSGVNPESCTWGRSTYAEVADQQTAERLAAVARQAGWSGVDVDEIVEVIEE